MDLFQYIQEYHVLACRACGTCVVPKHLVSHIWSKHRNYGHDFRTRPLIEQWIQERLMPTVSHGLLDPAEETLALPAPGIEPLPALPVHSGFECTHCSYITRNEGVMRQHYNVQHAVVRRHRGGNKATATGLLRERLDREHYGDQSPWNPISFQRFFTSVQSRAGARCFRVQPLPLECSWAMNEEVELPQIQAGRGSVMATSIFRQLAHLESTVEKEERSVSDQHVKNQVSPWLERTRWSQYLNGVQFSEAAKLADLPNPMREPAPEEISKSIDRLVSTAYASVCEDKVNFFGQKRITSFLPHKEVYSRPLVVKLQQSTYTQYKHSWKRLLAFTCRTSQRDCPINLRHRLNSRQTALLDSLLALANKHAAGNDSATDLLDRLCLDFCLSLLDHRLTGDIFESVIVGFLAVWGIDEANGVFHEAPNYTPKLSAFIKIAQLLVLQKAVYMAEDGITENPLDPLDEMRERFMTLNNSTSFTWALSFRSFGKRIRDSTTSLGYIQWSEDAQTVFYRDLELSMPDFRQFVSDLVHKAQRQLEALFLIGVDEDKADVIPRIALDRIRDNPTVTSYGWSFLKDTRNHDVLPPRDTWLLCRILETERLRDQFCALDGHRNVNWDAQAVHSYHSQVHGFLESLLLLVHISAGQPARGSEITGLQHRNTTFHRNIFIEDGLVAIVTSYHKGYNCTGTTKIIHRYLPREISELLIYYLWLILPFVQKLDLLCSGNMRPRRSQTNECQNSRVDSNSTRPTGVRNFTATQRALLWSDQGEAWHSSRLSTILKRETGASFTTPLTISTYRHVAIAISRRHLTRGGFRRDYGVEEQASDQQTTHTSWTAGRLYARGLEEGLGHVEVRRAGFRAVSRRWHGFLGFSVPAITQKRALDDVTNIESQKRRREWKMTLDE